MPETKPRPEAPWPDAGQDTPEDEAVELAALAQAAQRAPKARGAFLFLAAALAVAGLLLHRFDRVPGEPRAWAEDLQGQVLRDAGRQAEVFVERGPRAHEAPSWPVDLYRRLRMATLLAAGLAVAAGWALAKAHAARGQRRAWLAYHALARDAARLRARVSLLENGLSGSPDGAPPAAKPPSPPQKGSEP